MVKVSFIVVNWNGVNHLEECLNAICSQTITGSEIIVVDNASTDNSLEIINNLFPNVLVIKLTRNMGFTGGNIEGLKKCTGDFIALVNNDAVLSPVWLERMLYHLEEDSRIGICSSKILVYGTNRVDSVGESFTTAFTVTRPGEGEDGDIFKETRFVPGACAAAVIYRKEMLGEIGFFDDDFFLNHEDNDLSIRAWLAGWKCKFVPDAVAYHKVSSSIGILTDIAVYHFSRNSEWIWIKNVPIKTMLKYLPQRIIYEIAALVYYCLVINKWRPYIKGKVDALLNLPKMLKKRAQIQKLIILQRSTIEKDLIPLSECWLARLRQ